LHASNALILQLLRASMMSICAVQEPGQAMESVASRALATIWADATPLAKVLNVRAQRLLPRPSFSEDAPPGKRRSTTEQIALGFHVQLHMPDAQKAAKTEIRNDLVARRFVGLGRTPKSRSIQPIDASFWIDAEIDWEHDAVARGRKKIVAVRLVLPDAIKAMQATSEPRPGPASERDLILAAIKEYSKRDPPLRRPPAERYDAYRAFLTKKGRNPRRERGFSDSAFEKYELEYRRIIK
jgi:hypothetical protein